MTDTTAAAASTASRLRQNFLFLATSNLLAPLFSMVLVLAISRLRGVEELGKYSLVMTIFVLGQSCAGFGLPLIVTREVAQRPSEAARHFSTACLVTLTFLIPLLVAGFPLVQWITTDRELGWAIYLVLVALVITTVNMQGEAVLLGLERARVFVTINMVETVLRAIGGVALVVAGYGIVEVAAGLLFFRIGAALAYVLTLRRLGVPVELRVDRALARELLGHIPTVGMIPVVYAVYSRADVLLLTWLGTWTDVGLYSAAMRFIDLARTLPPAYARALYPVLARLQSGAVTEYRAAAQRGLRTALLMTGPLTLVLVGPGGWVLTLLYGPDLAAAVPSLQILAWTLLPLAIAVVLAQVLFSANRQAIDLRVNVVASVVTVSAGLLLIPRLGATGAAIATLLAGTVYAVLQYRWTERHVVDPQALGDVCRIGAATLCSAAAMLLLMPTSLWLGIVTGFLCYGGALARFGFLPRDLLARDGLAASTVRTQ